MLTFYCCDHYKAKTLLDLLAILMILFALQMILICKLFYQDDHLILLLFCFDSLFHHHLNFYFHHLYLMTLMFRHFHLYSHLHSHLLSHHLFDILILVFCQLKLYQTDC